MLIWVGACSVTAYACICVHVCLSVCLSVTVFMCMRVCVVVREHGYKYTLSYSCRAVLK